MLESSKQIKSNQIFKNDILCNLPTEFFTFPLNSLNGGRQMKRKVGINIKMDKKSRKKNEKKKNFWARMKNSTMKFASARMLLLTQRIFISFSLDFSVFVVTLRIVEYFLHFV